MTDERNPSDDVLEMLRRNGLWAERILSVLSAAGFVVLRVPQGDLRHGDELMPLTSWHDYDRMLYRVRRPVEVNHD